MPPDWDSRLARREALEGSGGRGAGTRGGEVIASNSSPQPPTAERLHDQPAREPCEPVWSANTAQFQAARTSFGPRQALELHRRLVRWRPAYWPLVVSYMFDLVTVGWFTAPFSGVLGWPLTVLWTWPILSTLTSIIGIRRTRKALRT